VLAGWAPLPLTAWSRSRIIPGWLHRGSDDVLGIRVALRAAASDFVHFISLEMVIGIVLLTWLGRSHVPPAVVEKRSLHGAVHPVLLAIDDSIR
jgi:hypothetical protein